MQPYDEAVCYQRTPASLNKSVCKPYPYKDPLEANHIKIFQKAAGSAPKFKDVSSKSSIWEISIYAEG